MFVLDTKIIIREVAATHQAKETHKSGRWIINGQTEMKIMRHITNRANNYIGANYHAFTSFTFH